MPKYFVWGDVTSNIYNPQPDYWDVVEVNSIYDLEKKFKDCPHINYYPVGDTQAVGRWALHESPASRSTVVPLIL